MPHQSKLTNLHPFLVILRYIELQALQLNNMTNPTFWGYLLIRN